MLWSSQHSLSACITCLLKMHQAIPKRIWEKRKSFFAASILTEGGLLGSYASLQRECNWSLYVRAILS